MTIRFRNPAELAASILVLASGVAIARHSVPPFAGQPEAGARGSVPRRKTFAQEIVADVAAKHHELTSLELSATPAGKQVCETIASTEAKGVGEKCDEDEFTSMKTGKPLVDKEEDEWDITIPLHDASGNVIGALGMDFKAKPGQQQSAVVRMASEITREIEKQIPSSAKLFELEN